DERICVVIGRTRHKMIQIELQEAAKRGARLIELRLDFIAKAPDFKRLLANRPCPFVATVRRPADGGRWAGTEDERRMLLRQASRLLCVKLGAPFTYAAFNKERGIAPGIPSFDELRQTYPLEHLDADTQVFGVVGDPVGHSLSPLIHNTAFRKLGLNKVYLPF